MKPIIFLYIFISFAPVLFKLAHIPSLQGNCEYLWKSTLKPVLKYYLMYLHTRDLSCTLKPHPN